MNWPLLTIGACFGSFLIQLPVQAPILKAFAQTAIPGISSAQRLSNDKPCDSAEAIAIRLLDPDENALGSGILIQKQLQGEEWRYTILTNAHVVTSEDTYLVQTPDENSYTANLLKRFDKTKSGDDLALLYFYSNVEYKVATLRAASTLDRGDEVFAAGFPLSANPSRNRGFACKDGPISVVLDREMRLGYQVGYFVDVEKGMSGGPLLNRQGEVVGINGKHSNPLPIGTLNQNPYEYKNGTPVSEPRELLNNSSWAIAIERFGQQAPIGLKLIIGSSDNSTPFVGEPTPTQASSDSERSLFSPLPSSSPPFVGEPTPTPPFATERNRRWGNPPPSAPSTSNSNVLPSIGSSSSVEPLFPTESFTRTGKPTPEDAADNCTPSDSADPTSEPMNASFDNVQAQLSYQEGSYRLTISREGEEFSYPLPKNREISQVLDLQIRDIDSGNGEPEVIVDFLSIREGCRRYSLTYRYIGLGSPNSPGGYNIFPTPSSK